MNIKIKSVCIILAVVIISCKNQNKENELPNSEQNEIVTKENQETISEESDIDQAEITEQLQGKWKEIEYPYRTAEFVDTTVKFIEEGTQNKSSFQQFEISKNCLFENNNIKDLQSGDIILSLPETKRCEKLTITNDTLTLHGFSTNSNEDYYIVYLKLE